MIDIINNIGSLNRQAWNVRWTDPDQSRHLTGEVQSLLAQGSGQIHATEYALHSAMVGRTDAWLNQGRAVSLTIDRCTESLRLLIGINEPRVQVDILCLLTLAEIQSGRHRIAQSHVRSALDLYEYQSDSYASLQLLASGVPARYLSAQIRDAKRLSEREPASSFDEQHLSSQSTGSDIEMFGNMISVAQQNQDSIAETALHIHLGFAHLEARNFSQALGSADTALTLSRDNHSSKLESASLYCLAEIDFHNNAHAIAETRALEVRGKAVHLKDELLAIRCDELLGRIYSEQQRADGAFAKYNTALGNAKSLNYVLLESRCYEALARLSEDREDYKSALEFFRKFHQVRLESEDAIGAAPGAMADPRIRQGSAQHSRPITKYSDVPSRKGQPEPDANFRHYFHYAGQPVIVLVNEGDWQVTAANKVALDMFGLREEQLNEVRISRFIQRRSLRSVDTAFESSLAMLKKRHYSEYSFVLPDEKLRDRHGGSIGCSLAVNLVKLDAKYRAIVSVQRTGSFDLPSARMQPDNDHFFNVDSGNAEFLESFNHEVRSLLTVIFGEAQLLRRDAIDGRSILSGAQVAQVEQLIENTRYLQTYIGELIDLSKTSEAQLEKIVLDRVNIRDMIDKAIADCQDDIVRKELEIQAQIDDDAPELVAMNATKVKRVLQIILRNFIRLTSIGTVIVSVTVEDRWWQCAVFNPMCDINDTQLRLMAALLSGDASALAASHEHEHGLESEVSLGLRLSQRLAALMGGDLSILSTEIQPDVLPPDSPPRVVLRLPLSAETRANDRFSQSASEFVSPSVFS